MRIGYNSLFSSAQFTTFINSFSNVHGLDIQLIPLPVGPLAIEKYDAIAFPAHLSSTEMDEQLKRLALVELGQRSYSLLLHESLVAHNHRFGFVDGMIVKHTPEFMSSGLKKIWNGFLFQQSTPSEIISDLKTNTEGCYVVESCFTGSLDVSDYKCIELSPREFGHTAGQGFMAISAPNTSIYHNVIRKMNTKATIAINNIERKIASLSESNIMVHCEHSSEGNYQVWAFDKETSAHVSQSTRVAIEENVISKLRK